MCNHPFSHFYIAGLLWIEVLLKFFYEKDKTLQKSRGNKHMCSHRHNLTSKILFFHNQFRPDLMTMVSWTVKFDLWNMIEYVNSFSPVLLFNLIYYWNSKPSGPKRLISNILIFLVIYYILVLNSFRFKEVYSNSYKYTTIVVLPVRIFTNFLRFYSSFQTPF